MRNGTAAAPFPTGKRQVLLHKIINLLKMKSGGFTAAFHCFQHFLNTIALLLGR